MLFTGDMVFVLITSFLLFFLGIFVFYKDSKQYINRSFFYLSLSILSWILSRYFEDIVSDEQLRAFYLFSDFAAGAFFAFSILLFCLDIAKVKAVERRFFRSLFFLVPGLIAVLIYATPFILSGYEINRDGIIDPIYGVLGSFYDIVVTFIPLSGIGFIIWGFRRSPERDRARYIYSLIGIFLTLSIILLTNVIMVGAIEGSGNYHIYSIFGIFSPILIVLFSGYSIIRYRIFNTKIIATETLSFIILLVTFLQVFLSEDMYQIIVRGIIFLSMTVLIGMLVKSVDTEINRKEELQEIAMKLAVANEELRKLDNTKSEFISIASHQLRTPLTAIKGFLSLVLEGSYGKISAEVEDVLNKVYSANSHLVELVENLLNISRIESGRIQYTFAKADITDTIRELADAFSVVAKGRKLDFAFVHPEMPVPPFLMDSQKIREVISNMIDNAIKYTQQGGVTVRLSHDREKVRVAVSDTGVGIAPEELSVLFQKFRRGKDSGKVNVSGTGLGLYVGKNFAEAHGGRIFVESDGVGKGSTFTLELPFRIEKGVGAPKAEKA